MSFRSLLLTGNIVDTKFCYHDLPEKLDIFDNETFMKSKSDFYVVVSNIETGKPEYILCKDMFAEIDYLRASASMPFVSKIVQLNNKKYLDGGVSDSIPVYYNKENYNKNIVILTQPLNYKKKPLSKIKEMLIKLKYHKYPKLITIMLNRYERYNKLLEEIKEMEEKGEIFVIRPSKNLNIKINESSKDKLDEIYNVGKKVAKEKLKDLKKYLEDK
jgi:predicted patatin/cPLA2 family phospholipase